MREQNTKAQEKNRNSKIILTPCPPTHTLIQINHPPTYPIPPTFVITIQWDLMLKLLTVFFILLERFVGIAANQLCLKKKKKHAVPIKYSVIGAALVLVIK